MDNINRELNVRTTFGHGNRINSHLCRRYAHENNPHRASTASFYDIRIESFEFVAGVGGGELPIDTHLRGVAGGGPSPGFTVNHRRLGDTSG